MIEFEMVLQHWLNHLGLRFDPFLPLDASQDPRLSEYRVDHDTFNAVWGDWVSFVFAPPGGGKTALRVNTAQSSWIGQGTNRPFPITCEPPYLQTGRIALRMEDHLATLCRAGASQLMLGLAHRPHWFLNRDAAAQRAIRQALDWNLPGPVATYVDQCRQTQTPRPLQAAFDPTFQIGSPPNAVTLNAFWETLSAIPPASSARPTPAARWAHLSDLLLNTLAFQSLYILVDGIDAVYETMADPATAIASIAGLLDQAAVWQHERIYLKGFFPANTQPIFTRRYPDLAASAQIAIIQWTPALLAQVIQKRLYVASDGAFNSLNAIGSPGLPGSLEHLLAESVIPLPREILVLTREVLRAHITGRGSSAVLELEDVEAGIATYRQKMPEFRLTR